MKRKRENILLVRLSALGDIVHILHAVSGLRRAVPELRVGMLCEERFTAMADIFHCIDVTHGTLLRKQTTSVIMESLRKLRRKIAGQYDTVLDLHGMFKSVVAARRSAGGAEVVGFTWPAAKELSHVFLDRRIDVDPKSHTTDKTATVFSELFESEIRPDPVPGMRLPASPIEPGKPYVVVPVGTSVFAKIWPPEHVGRLAELLSGDFEVYVSGGPGEATVVKEICNSSPAKPVLGLSVPQLAAFMAGAEAVAGADTGPVQLASATGTPVVAMYGPTLSGRSRPRGPRVTILDPGVDCAGCYEWYCPKAKQGEYSRCMTDFTPEIVAQAVLKAAEVQG